MKARLHPPLAMQKAIDAYAEAKIQGIQSRAQEAVMKERNDNDQLADLWAQVTLQSIGIEAPKTKEPL